jgi:glycosyltransferase involved in cell wall biosynthesis
MIKDKASPENIKVSVVIPALNEEANINDSVMDVIRAFEKLNINGEIIVVNDGSTDRTGVIVERLISKYPFIRMITHDKAEGIGSAYWDGVKHSSGDVVTWVSGDFESNAYDILRYLPLLEDVDIVIPFVYNDKTRRTWMLRARSVIYTMIVDMSFRFLLSYTNGNVIFRRSVIKDLRLKSKGFFFQTELLIKCLKRGYLYSEVPIAAKLRSGGEPRSFSFKSLLNVMSDYLSTLVDFYLLKNCGGDITPDSVTALRHTQTKGREERFASKVVYGKPEENV